MLVEHPTAAAARHLLEWLGGLSDPETTVSLVHPQGDLPELPPGVRSQPVRPIRRGWERLQYDQIALPRAAAEVGAQVLLILGEQVPLRARMPIAAVPPILPQPPTGVGFEMLRRAAGGAGLRGASSVLMAADLARETDPKRLYTPFVSPAFLRPAVKSAGPERLRVLCYDTDPQAIRRALAAWTWVDGSLGDSYPLQFLSWDPRMGELIHAMAAEFDVADSVSAGPPTHDLAKLYREAAAFLSVRPLAWGQPFRWALASGVPIAAFESPAAGSIVGDAGYLVPDGDTRALGAACLSLLVQEELAESLRVKGQRRAAAYHDRPPTGLITELADQAIFMRGGQPPH